jgi:hypothetical protein
MNCAVGRIRKFEAARPAFCHPAKRLQGLSQTAMAESLGFSAPKLPVSVETV